MTHEQSRSGLEQELQEAEIDVLVREIEVLVTGYDIELLRMAVKVGSNLPHFRHENGEAVGESLHDQIRRELTNKRSR